MNQAKIASNSLEMASLEDKRILVRLDLDLPLDESGKITDVFRLEKALPTLEKCLKLGRQLTILGHLGRPEGRDSRYSLIQLADTLRGLLNHPITFVDNVVKLPRVKDGQSGENVPKIQLLENLRFWPGELQADSNFAHSLAVFGDLYINEAFAVAHHPSASVTALPHLLPTYLGYQFQQEVETSLKVISSAKKPIVLILGGAKSDKLKLLPQLLNLADKVLLGGRLPEQVNTKDPKLVLGESDQSTFDLTPRSSQQFAEIINTAGTVIWNGPVGKFEDPKYRQGTKTVAEAVVASPAFSLVGGGDTQAALAELGLADRVDHLSTGGGSLLTLLATGTLPALEAIFEPKV